MNSWNFGTVLDFLMKHARQRIVIREQGTTMRVSGVLAEVGDRDACSLDLVEADLDTGIAGLHCSLTLHENTLLVHLSGPGPESPLFVPVSIPYEDLFLDAAKPAAPSPDIESSPTHRSV